MQHCIAAVGFTGSPGWFTVGRRAKVPHAAMLGANSGKADETEADSLYPKQSRTTYILVWYDYIQKLYHYNIQYVNIVSYIQYINVYNIAMLEI